MDFKFGNLIFSSNFDSGNLASVEQVKISEENGNNIFISQSDPIKVDYEFNVWTKPDCMGTVFENTNRTWFYFSVRGYMPDKMIKITIKNLNRHQRLYGQGYCPLFKTDTNNPEDDKWFRIPYRPTWSADTENFQLSFLHHLSDIKKTSTYFAFCYPWSYKDCQKQLDEFDAKYRRMDSSSWEMLSTMSSKTIYYKRELFTRSLEGRRIDLITITDLSGLCKEREEVFDNKLFPECTERPWKFKDKKVFVVTSRVHPGETPSSHVFNGFLNFILRTEDPRSIQLRKQYIFKLIPLLNPDGVFHGHYRTDSRGVNLNRVYLNPDFTLYPSIYASKSLVVYHHIFNSCETKDKIFTIISNVYKNNTPYIIPTEVPRLVNSALDLRRTAMAVFQRRESDVNENHIEEISKCVRNVSFENEESENKNSQISSSIVFDNTEYSRKNDLTEDIQDSNPHELFYNDCYEVFVETESLPINKYITKIDKNVPERIPERIPDFIPEAIPDQIQEFGNCEIPETNRDLRRVVFTDNNDQFSKQSIYRFVNPLNRFNPIIPLSDSDHHQWNLRGHHAKLLNRNNIQTTEINNELNTTPSNQHQSMIPVPLQPTLTSLLPCSRTYTNIYREHPRITDMHKVSKTCDGVNIERRIGNEGSDDETDKDCSAGLKYACAESLHLSHPDLLTIPVEKSGISFYIDLHGHCSKRGCFVYGNFLESEEHMVENLLYPKLISLNSPHFDFLGCNFSLRNMFTKDVKDGTSKEGCGRVATWKHLGLIHCYTLECNYNTGRTINPIPPKYKDDGKASPPSMETTCLLPPKYTPFHFENVGKAMAIAALDMSQTNPLSRITNSEYVTLRNVRLYVRRFMASQNIGFGKSFSLNRRKGRKTKPPSTTSISLISRSGSMSLNTAKKSISFAVPNATNNNGDAVMPFLSNVIYSIFHQTGEQEDEIILKRKLDNLRNSNVSLIPRNIPDMDSYFAQYDNILSAENVKPLKDRPPSSKNNLSAIRVQMTSQASTNEEISPFAMSSSRHVSEDYCLIEAFNNNQNNNAVRRNFEYFINLSDCTSFKKYTEITTINVSKEIHSKVIKSTDKIHLFGFHGKS